MGTKRTGETFGLWSAFLRQVIFWINESKKQIASEHDKYNPLCEYILRVEGSKKGYIASVNTRKTARNIKREYQSDKGVKVKIIQYLYSSDRLDGGMIISAKEVW